jgi:hypothetical protein
MESKDKLQKNNNSSLVLHKLSRPLLAIISEDFPKIKNITDLSEQDELINYLITLLNIKVSNKEEQKNLEIQMLVIIDFIKSKFGFLTIPEIREAFKMYIAKEFGHKDIYRQLDTIVVSDVLNCFMNFRADNLRAYTFKKQTFLRETNEEMSEEEKDKIVENGVNRFYEEYKTNKTIEDPSEYIFDHLIKKGLIKNNNNPKVLEYYQGHLQLAKTQLQKENAHSSSLDKADRQRLKIDLEQIVAGHSPKIILRAKKNILAEYFEAQIKAEKEKIF